MGLLNWLFGKKDRVKIDSGLFSRCPKCSKDLSNLYEISLAFACKKCNKTFCGSCAEGDGILGIGNGHQVKCPGCGETAYRIKRVFRTST